MTRFPKAPPARVWRRLAVAAPLLAVLAAVAAAWGVLCAAIPPPRQDFPLIDDWSFARLAFGFARGEGARYDGWPSMPLLGQWVWSCPFVWAVGESFAALRASTVVLSCLGLAGLFDLLRSEPGVSARSAAFGAAAVAFNPFYFMMTGTYMTDVPALSMSLVALALVRRAAASGRAAPLLAGCAAAVLAAITRQNALAAPLAAALLPARSVRARLASLGLGVLVPVAAGLAAVWWFGYQPGVHPKPRHTPTTQHAVDVVLRHAHVLGLSAVPALLLRPRRMLRRRFLLWLGLAGFATLAWLDANNAWYNQPYLNHLQPPAGNALRATGVYAHRHGPEALGSAVRVAMTLAGVVGLAGMVAGPGGRVRVGGAGRCLLAFGLIQTVLLFFVHPVFDRYVLVLLPVAVLRTVPRRSGADRPSWWLGLAALGVSAAVSVALTHDWFAWNSARWELGRRAVARGVAPEDIEGGFEWDGWHSPLVTPPETTEARHRGLSLPYNSQVFPRLTGRYAVAMTEPGLGPNELLPVVNAASPRDRPAREVDSEPYRLWLSPGRRRLVLVRPE